MSHFFTLVIVPKDTKDIKGAVAELLAPFDEDGVWGAEGTRWDWWVIGGRWTGRLDGYKPEKDPQNIEDCDLCNRTGKRTDMVGRANPVLMERCNGCAGTGRRVKWPTQWASHDGDIAPVSVALKKRGLLPVAVVTPDGRWHEEAHVGMFGMTIGKTDGAWKKTFRGLLKANAENIAVVVDCHV